MPIPLPTIEACDRWFHQYYIVFQCIRFGYPSFAPERLRLQTMDKEVGRLLHKKEEDLGIWHCNDAWRNYLGFELHGYVENLYHSFHKMRMAKGYDLDVLTAMLIVGVCIITEKKLREDVCMLPTVWTTKAFECI